MVILDTSIIIDHLRVHQKNASLLRRFLSDHPDEECLLSVVSVSELYAGKSVARSEEEQEVLTTISPFTIIPYDYEVAVFTGKLMRTRRGLTLPDAAIAATALIRGGSLFTLNVKDFSPIQGLTLLRV